MVLRGALRGGQPAPALSPDGKTLAAAVGNKIHLWDIASGKELRALDGPRPGMAGFAFAPDSKRLAVRGADRAISVIDAASGKEVCRVPQDKQPQGALRIAFFGQQRLSDTGRLAFAPDGKTIASAETGVDANKQATEFIRFVEADTGKEIRRIDLQANNGALAIAYSPDGKLLAYTDTRTIHLCHATTGEEIHAIKGPAGVTALVFAPDSKSLAVRGVARGVDLWDTATGKQIHRLGDGGQAVIAGPFVQRFQGGDPRVLAFSPDGKTLATGDGNSIRCFDTATGKEEPLAGGHRGPVSAVHVSADGKTLVSRGADGMIRAWDSEDFTVRDGANRELARLGELALPALHQMMARPNTLEMRRRAEVLLAKLNSGTLMPEQLRLVRAVEVLETAATPAACAVLEALAKGAPGVLSTREAQAALERLGAIRP